METVKVHLLSFPAMGTSINFVILVLSRALLRSDSPASEKHHPDVFIGALLTALALAGCVPNSSVQTGAGLMSPSV